MSRFTCPVAVHLFLIQEDQVLLLRRANTGYEDGNYSLIAGHVDGNETVAQAMQREAMEEAGIEIALSDLEVVQVMQRKCHDGKQYQERIDYFLYAKQWKGEIRNLEPEKCDQLRWTAMASLPSNVIPYIRHALAEFVNNQPFTQFGWSEE